jgi:hypothetical protein
VGVRQGEAQWSLLLCALRQRRRVGFEQELGHLTLGVLYSESEQRLSSSDTIDPRVRGEKSPDHVSLAIQDRCSQRAPVLALEERRPVILQGA